MRVLHFVTGGFSGATQVAVDLCLAARGDAGMQAVLALRLKRHTPPGRVEALRAQGLEVHLVPGWSHLATVLALRRLALRTRPDVLVAHGFSEHIWGRYAGLLARVPQLVHVEHNSRERYTRWRLWQSRWLARRTAAIVGVSHGVQARLLALGFPAERCVAIPNGIDLGRFPREALLPWAEREPVICMASRFGRQKDHGTLVGALAELAGRGLHPRLDLAGGGKARMAGQLRSRVAALGLSSQVRFLGSVSDLPQRLVRQQVFVLSTHYEGMPLALCEAMAAGCACIATDVVGAREVIVDGQTGLLVPENDPVALADAIQRLLQDGALAARLGAAARLQAEQSFGADRMLERYRRLFEGLRPGSRPAG
ncbi:glycosyltransferase [Xylophilus sp. Kf1]|nr:glycosyltransferase [Xylophilus sp. Kf1]